MDKYFYYIIGIFFLLISSVCLADEDIDLRINQDLQKQVIEQEQRLLQTIKSTAEPDSSGMVNVTEEDISNITNNIFIAINQRNWPHLKELLQQYQNITGFDPNLVKFAEASLAQGEGNYNQAITLYQQLITDYPDFVRGRLELARALFEDNQSKEAKQEFAKIDLGGTHPNIQENIQIYHDAIKAREQWQSYLSLGYLHNTNINHGSNKSICLREILGICLFRQSGQPSSATRGFEYEFSTRKRWSLLGHHGINFKINSYGSAFKNNSDYNENTHNIALGYSFKNAKSELILLPNFGINSKNNDKMHHSYGFEANWQYLLNPKTMFYSGYQYKNYIYTRDNYHHHSGVGHTLNTSLTYLLPYDFIIFAGIDLNSKGAEYKLDRYRQFTGRMGIVKNFGGFETTLYSSIMRRKYRDFHFFYQTYRRDTEKNIILTINAPRWNIWGITPGIRFKHNRTKSNVDWIYSNKSSEINLRLYKYF